MSINRSWRTFVANVLILTITSSYLAPHASADIISTEAALGTPREQILALLDRADVASQLQAYGVAPSEVKARIAVMTDAEIAELSTNIDKAQAGAGGGNGLVLAALMLVLLPFVIVALVLGGVIKLASRG